MKVVAVVQARLGSTRFPGKVLAPLAGQPVLWHLLTRLRRCRRLDQIVVATSTEPGDDALAAWAEAAGATVVRGPQDNVLERFLLAAEQTGADVVVRITGDVPLVDPDLVDALVAAIVDGGAEHVLGQADIPTLHEGIDPFTVGALHRLRDEAGDDPVAREHVSAWFKLHPDRVRQAVIPLNPAHANPGGARTSVDTPADLAFLEAVYRRLGVPAGDADLAAVSRLLHDEPELMAINRHIHQKDAAEKTRTALIRCDGGGALGMGHVVRCLAVADHWRERLGWGVAFAMLGPEPGIAAVEAAGFPVLRGAGDEAAWLTALVEQRHPDALLVDVRTDLDAAALAALRGRSCVAVLDDGSPRRLAADLAFYPPVPQVERLDWSGMTGERLVGWEWLALRRQFCGAAPAHANPTPVVLVSMGGSDPAGLTLQACDALDALAGDFAPVLVLGTDFRHEAALQARLAQARRTWRIERAVADMAGLMATADLALVAYGGTAHELAAVGVPALYLCLSEDHADSAAGCAAAGFGESLGLARDIAPAAIAARVAALLADPERRRRMAERGRAAIDGCGGERIARRIAARVEATPPAQEAKP